MASPRGRAQLLARLNRHEEAAQTAQRQLRLAERSTPGLAATTAHDLGPWPLRSAATRRLPSPRPCPSEGAHVQPTGRPGCDAEALARAGDPAAARLRLRAAVARPGARQTSPGRWFSGGVRPASSPPRKATQVLRLRASRRSHCRLAPGPRVDRLLTAEGYLANLVDLGASAGHRVDRAESASSPGSRFPATLLLSDALAAGAMPDFALTMHTDGSSRGGLEAAPRSSRFPEWWGDGHRDRPDRSRSAVHDGPRGYLTSR